MTITLPPNVEATQERDPVFGELFDRHGGRDVSGALVEACRALSAAHSAEAPPVSLDPLLKATNARCETRSLSGDGRLEVDPDGRFVVVVDDQQHWSRQRFTIAHELAHIVLFSEIGDDPAALRQVRSPELWPAVERACNAAAAELLMPARDVAKAAKRFGLGPGGLGELQARYAVSWSALLVRLSEVLSIPVAVFRFHARTRTEPERWRVHRFYGSKKGLWLPKGLTTRHLSEPIVERAAELGLVDAELVIDAPTEVKVRALASSLVDARECQRQEVLFGRRPPREVARWPEVAVFLGVNGSPDPRDSISGTEDRQSEFPNLTLW